MSYSVTYCLCGHFFAYIYLSHSGFWIFILFVICSFLLKLFSDFLNLPVPVSAFVSLLLRIITKGVYIASDKFHDELQLL